jgi:serine/threonine protein kinase
MERSEFLKHLRHSRLISGEQVGELAERFPEENQARAMAHALVADGVLTRFQARKVLEGKAGWLVLGQYRILDRLGHGGMAHVFKAVHATMERVVALKIVLPSLLKDPQTLDLFRREVRAAAQLHHPNIVTAYDAGELRGLHYLVLEYVEGVNLYKLVRNQGPLDPATACDVIRQAALALQYAFEKGMVHRDIKPSNLILCQPDGLNGSGRPQVKVFDFGLARLTSTAVAKAVETIMVESGTILGTLDYISPEQAHDVHGVDIRSDLYSLGCTFYYALAGQVPFPGNPMEKLVRHLMRDPQPLRELRPEVPEPLAEMVGRLMAKDKEKRYQTPSELAEALAPWCGLSRSAAPATGPGTVELVSEAGVSAPHAPSTLDEPVVQDEDDTTVRILADAETSMPSIEERDPEEAVALAAPAPFDEGKFRTAWRRWTGLIEYFARGKGPASAVNAEAFRAVHKELVQGCARLAEACEGERSEFFRGLEWLVGPWMTPDVLAKTEPDLLFDLFERCQRAAVEIDLLTGALRELPSDQPTGLTGILARFRARQERHEFSAEMERVFGVKF